MNKLNGLTIIFLSIALVFTNLTLFEVKRNLADAMEALEWCRGIFPFTTVKPVSHDTSTPGTTTPERLAGARSLPSQEPTCCMWEGKAGPRERLRGIDGRDYEINH